MKLLLKEFFNSSKRLESSIGRTFLLVKSIMLILFMMQSGVTKSQLNIVPAPVELKLATGFFSLSPATSIVLQGSGLEKTARLLNEKIKSNYGFVLPILKKTGKENSIVLNYEKMEHPFSGAYSININSHEIYIAGDNETGVFYGIQTLIQLLPITPKNDIPKSNIKLSIPQLSITDYPRFAYRGMHLDVSRHFFSVEQVKKYIDYLAAYKFNTFHWHLTDDQGWRIEIKKYPMLTSIGGFRNGTIIGPYPGTGNDSIHYGGFYSQEQIKDVVKYAAERYINIIPEIEMPGHSSAAIAAYPQLSCFPDESTKIPEETAWAGSRNGKQVPQSWGVFEDVFAPTDYTFKFLEDVLDEVILLFPSKYIHIGGDECPKESWKRSAFCQQLIKEKKLGDEHGLQSYFIQRIEKYINSKGKKIIGWDEILEGGLAPNATVMSWRGEAGGIAAAKQNHDVIMTPENPLYLNHSQSNQEDSITQGGFNPIQQVYAYEPVPKELNKKEAVHILGAQGNMWAEHIHNQRKLEYMLFPRIAALSEVLWSPKEKRNWKDFEKRLPTILQRLDEQNINYSNAYFEPTVSILPNPDYNGINLKVNNKRKNALFYFGNKTMSEFKLYRDSIQTNINQSGIYGIRMIKKLTPELAGEKWGVALLSGAEYLFTTDLNISFNKATGKKITLKDMPSDNYPGDGAFTLVNGIQNDKGLARSSEFLGFLGEDMEAVIDLGTTEKISIIKLHAFEQTASWIYLPSAVVASFSNDGINFTNEIILNKEGQNIFLSAISTGFTARFLKVSAKNFGVIPDGKPGSGNAAWLFVDEIEVD